MTLSFTKLLSYTVPKLKDFSQAAFDGAAKELLSALEQESEAVETLEQWKAFRDRWQARKKGIVTQIRETWLKSAPTKARADAGKTFNELKSRIEDKVDQVRQSTMRREEERTSGPPEESSSPKYASAAEAIRAIYEMQGVDISLPGIRRPIGAEHPVIRTQHEIIAVFRNLGYSVAEGPVIETDYYNFEALNFPPNHPARDTQDTLFLANQGSKSQREQLLLRTHTSPVQIRTMEKMKPPLRILIPGKVHRNDPPDASHSPMFHQVEGLAVDTNITFGDLKGAVRIRR
jgi:phenylalanyl-tRNA synthetase alpha chain